MKKILILAVPLFAISLNALPQGGAEKQPIDYVNPIIGRVIAGYAFNETDTYHATEAASTLKNGSPMRMPSFFAIERM